MTLLADLDPFFQEHDRCSDLDGGLDGDRDWMTCSAWTTGAPTMTDQRGRLLRSAAVC